MPEIITEQRQEIINYINMLNLPYSEAVRDHMANFVSGIITTEETKLFLQFTKSLPVTGIGAAAQDF